MESNGAYNLGAEIETNINMPTEDLPSISEIEVEPELTPEQLEEEKQEQLKQFIEDKTLEELYSRFVPRNKRVVVQIFEFKPSRRTALDKGLFMVKSDVDQIWRPRTLAISEKIYPIVKVIRKADDCKDDILVGQTYTVPVDEITGTSWNPDFMHALQHFAGQAGTQGSFTNVPENMPQRLPNIQIHWKNFIFGMPDRAGLQTEDDALIFLIPEARLETVYEHNT